MRRFVWCGPLMSMHMFCVCLSLFHVTFIGRCCACKNVPKFLIRWCWLIGFKVYDLALNDVGSVVYSTRSRFEVCVQHALRHFGDTHTISSYQHRVTGLAHFAPAQLLTLSGLHSGWILDGTHHLFHSTRHLGKSRCHDRRHCVYAVAVASRSWTCRIHVTLWGFSF